MLQQLKIKNYALLENLNIHFDGGLTILTGETGAGKSILVGALGLILGDRAFTEVIRTGEDVARVEGAFDISENAKVKKVLEEIGLENDDELLFIAREVHRNGKNKCFINGSLVTLSMLNRVGDYLVDMHGQHAHQSLLILETQRDFIDAFGNLFDDRKDVKRCYQDYQQTKNKLKKFKSENEKLKEQLDLYQFQLNEIEAANLYEEEQEELSQELNILENIELLFENSNYVFQNIYEKEGAVYDVVSNCIEKLEEIAEIDSNLKETFEHLQNSQIVLQEVSFFLQKYVNKLSFDPHRLEEIRLRQSVLRRLEKKYKRRIPDIIDLGKSLKDKIESVENFDEKVSDLENLLNQKRLALSEKAIELSEKRKTVSRKIETLIKKELKDLSLENARFNIAIENEELKNGVVRKGEKYFWCDETGMDKIEFRFSANVGEELASLVKVASGGEISRFMLAMKSIMANMDRIPTLIFDEIDTGIGGKTAENVGNKLKNLSHFHQVIAITHLPQIASKGKYHFSVRKEISNGRTKTNIDELNKTERIREIARMLGGEKEITLKHAEELLNE